MKKAFFSGLILLLTFVTCAQSGNGQIAFNVTHALTGMAVDAQIQIEGNGVSRTLQLNKQGKGSMALTPGRYTISETAAGFRSQTASYTVEADKLLTLQVSLDPEQRPVIKTIPNKGIISGYISDAATNQPLAGVQIFMQGSIHTAQTDAKGHFEIISDGYTRSINDNDIASLERHVIIASKKGYGSIEMDDLLLLPDNLVLKLRMQPNGPAEKISNLQHILDEKDIIQENIPEPGIFNAPVLNNNTQRTSGSCSPPPVIRLYHGANSTACTSCSGCTVIEQMSLETYTGLGLDDEWIASWNDASLLAGAVAYRTYGAYHIIHPYNNSTNYDIVAYPCRQNWNGSTSYAATINATAATLNEILIDNAGNIAFSEYAAETNNFCTCGDGYSGHTGLWPCISDNVCVTKVAAGHGRGMCQWGSHRWAQAGKTYTWILDHYYNPGGVFRCQASTCPTAANDLCGNAITIFPSTTPAFVNGTTCGAKPISSPFPNTCVVPGCAASDVWYKFTAQANTTLKVQSGTNFDAIVQTFSAVTCGTSYADFQCTNTTGEGGSETVTGFTAATTYYVRIYNNINLTGSDFQISVQEAAPTCTDNFETNDDCNTATMVFASPLKTNPANAPFQGNIGYNGDQDWYRIDAASCGTLTIDLSNLPANYDLQLYAAGAGCSGALLQSSANAGTTAEQIVYNISATTPVTVYAKVFPAVAGTINTASCYLLNIRWSPSAVKPSIAIVQTSCNGSDVNFSSAITNGGSSPVYRWDFVGTGTVSGGSTSPTFTLTGTSNGTTVTCELTSNAGCAVPVKDTSRTLTVSCITTPVSVVDGVEYFRVLPNPSHGIFRVELKLLQSANVQFRLLNVQGQAVYISPASRMQGIQTKDISTDKLSSGYYFLEAKINMIRVIYKITIL